MERQELATIGTVDEIHVPLTRADHTPGPAVPIWVVHLGDDQCVRSYRVHSGRLAIAGAPAIAADGTMLVYRVSAMEAMVRCFTRGSVPRGLSQARDVRSAANQRLLPVSAKRSSGPQRFERAVGPVAALQLRTRWLVDRVPATRRARV